MASTMEVEAGGTSIIAAQLFGLTRAGAAP